MASSVNTLEQFPDELLLLIYRYLSSTDILFSFYGLNSRFTQTISGSFRHVVLGQVPFRQFNSICTSILPEISTTIRTLVVSNDWKGVLSRVFLDYFGEKMACTFPHLKRLILTTFRMGSLSTFLDCLENLPHLTELKLVSLYEMGDPSIEPEFLLDRIFTTNNNRLTSIWFDDDCLSFPYSHRYDRLYPHIEKLVIEMKTLYDLHQLLTALPRLKFIDVAIIKDFTVYEKSVKETPIDTLQLQHFRCRSYSHAWNFDDLVSIINRLPALEELLLEIDTCYDASLLDGEQIFSHLSHLPLRKFSYFLQLDDTSIIDETTVLGSWQQFNQQVFYLQNDDEESAIFFTTLFDSSYLILRHSTARNQSFTKSYAPHIRCLTLYEVSPRIVDIFPIINQCHRLECLVLRIDERIVLKSSPFIPLRKFSSLTFLVALEKSSVHADDFRQLLEASPNLYHLAVNYEFIEPLLDNQSVCGLLERRITHLLLGVSSSTDLQSISTSLTRIVSVFPALRHLYFHVEKNNQSGEMFISSIFKFLCNWTNLVSFGVANIAMDSRILTSGLREWVLENSHLKEEDSFLSDYSAETFRLWL